MDIDIQDAVYTSMVDRPSNQKALTQKWGAQSILTLCWSAPSQRKPSVHPPHHEPSPYCQRHLQGKQNNRRFFIRLNLGIKLWPTEDTRSIRVSLAVYDAVSIWLRNWEIEVIVWAKYCPPVDTAQLLPTPLTVLSVPSYIKAITSSKG